jgi:hypothetical protein
VSRREQIVVPAVCDAVTCAEKCARKKNTEAAQSDEQLRRNTGLAHTVALDG